MSAPAQKRATRDEVDRAEREARIHRERYVEEMNMLLRAETALETIRVCAVKRPGHARKVAIEMLAAIREHWCPF